MKMLANILMVNRDDTCQFSSELCNCTNSMVFQLFCILEALYVRFLSLFLKWNIMKIFLLQTIFFYEGALLMCTSIVDN